MFDHLVTPDLWTLLGCGAFLLVAVGAIQMAPIDFYPPKKTVFYMRYSSLNQRGDSIDDQFRNITAHLARNGIPYSNVIKLTDEAVTGTTTKREDFQVLLEMIKRDEVDLVAVDDMSRLTRGKDYGLLWDEMAARGCRFISVLDNLDSTHDGDELSAMIKGLMNNITNKINGKRARRGLVGRVLDPNASAGYHPYGYISRPSDPDAAARYTSCGSRL